MLSLRTALVPVVAAALIVLPGCGSGDEPSGFDAPDATAAAVLADAMPAGSRLYAQADLRPEGELRDHTLAVLGRLLDKPPSGVREAIISAIDDPSDRDGPSFREAEPYIGRFAAAAFWDLAAHDAPSVGDDFNGRGALVIESPDPQKLLDLLSASDKKVEEREYSGTRYLVQTGGDRSALGVIAGRVVAASDAKALEAMIDVAGGKAALAADESFGKDGNRVSRDALGYLWVDIPGLIDDLAAAATSDEERDSYRLLEKLMGDGRPTATAQLTVPGERALRLEIAGHGTGGDDGDDGVLALGSLPAGSWAALALGDLGRQLSRTLDAAGEAGRVGGQDVDALTENLSRQFGVDLVKDVTSWMGKAGLFVSGDTTGTLGGGLVIESKDGQKSRGLLAKIVKAAGGQSGMLIKTDIDGADAYRVKTGERIEPVIAASDKRFVAATGEQQAKDLLDGRGGLGDDERFKRTTGELGGGDPFLFVNMQTVVKLVRENATDSDSREAVTYLERLDGVAGGCEPGGLSCRLVLTVR